LLRNDETIISSISVTDIVFDVYLGKWNYRAIPKVKTWSYFLTIPKDNLGDYVVTLLKQYVLSIVFLILSIVLIGIPALFFTNSILIANFYGNYIEQKHTLAFKTQSKDQLTV